jgi:energy-coupling factor transporter ATP-binding protein EcfA2
VDVYIVQLVGANITYLFCDPVNHCKDQMDIKEVIRKLRKTNHDTIVGFSHNPSDINAYVNLIVLSLRQEASTKKILYGLDDIKNEDEIIIVRLIAENIFYQLLKGFVIKY